MSNRRLANIALVLGIASLIAGVVGALALTDISHGEADVTVEWRALQVAAIVVLAFHAIAIAALRRLRQGGTG